jgi:hypothetical protein
MIGHVRRHEDRFAVALVIVVGIAVWIVTRRNEGHVPDEIDDARIRRTLD